MTKIIGITGGIASGKSTVVEEIRQAGYQVIDADAVVHDLQAKGGQLYQALLDWLGPEILRADGQLDRPKLSQLIFSSPEHQARSAQLQNDIIRQALAQEAGLTAKTLTIGCSAATTGPLASSGLDIQRGTEAAMAQINARGGIHGRALQLLMMDDAYEPERTAANVRQMLAQGQVFALLSCFGTPNNQAILPLVEESGIPYVAPLSGAMSLRKGTPLHRVLGGSWVGAMLVTALGSFWIQSRGHLSWIHLLSVWTVLGLAHGIWSLWRGRVLAHRQAMRGLMVGLAVAFVFTLTPERLLGRWLWQAL